MVVGWVAQGCLWNKNYNCLREAWGRGPSKEVTQKEPLLQSVFLYLLQFALREHDSGVVHALTEKVHAINSAHL